MKKSVLGKNIHVIISALIIVVSLVIAVTAKTHTDRTDTNVKAADGTESTMQSDSNRAGSSNQGKQEDSLWSQITQPIEQGEEFYEKALEHIQNGNNEAAIKELRRIPSSSKYYMNAQERVTSLEDEYRASVLYYARMAYESGDGWNEACKILRSGCELLPGDQELLSAIDMYEDCEPVGYHQLEHRNELGSVDYREGEDRDANGVIHRGYYYKFWDHCMGSRASITKYTFAEYNRFRGEYYVPKQEDGSAMFKVYGDERELFNSGEITRKETNGSFDIDITGVMEVQIVVDGMKYNWDNTVSLYLFNPEVYNLPTFD